MQATKLFRSFAAKQVAVRRMIHPGIPVGAAEKYSLNEIVTTMNDLPSPQGSWKTHFDSKQTKYNAQLVAGIAVLIGTIVFGKAVGYLEFYNDIPERIADIPSYK